MCQWTLFMSVLHVYFMLSPLKGSLGERRPFKVVMMCFMCGRDARASTTRAAECLISRWQHNQASVWNIWHVCKSLRTGICAPWYGAKVTDMECSWTNIHSVFQYKTLICLILNSSNELLILFIGYSITWPATYIMRCHIVFQRSKYRIWLTKLLIIGLYKLIGHIISDAIVCSWMGSTATGSCSLG